MMHVKNTLMLLDSAVNVYLQRKLLNNELALNTTEECAKRILAWVEQERQGTATNATTIAKEPTCDTSGSLGTF